MIGRTVNTICPSCNRSIEGKIYRKEDKVFLEKTCPDHGTVVDMLSSNADMFADRMSLLDHPSPNRCGMEKCRAGIFKCMDHVARKSPLAFIEITTRCNMKCPVCYADAEGKGRDIPLEDMKRIIAKIAEEDPKTHIILIGGEPTIHKDFFEILAEIRKKGLMKRAFIATNAITLADRSFCEKVRQAGLKKFFLAFDGTDREACKEIRGSYISYDSLRKALQNIRETGKAWIILSITAVKDINVEDIPRAIEFAMDNSDIVKRVMISPEVYCGRICEKDNLAEERLTGDCIEAFLREKLGVKVAAVSLSLFFAVMKPFKAMGILAPESWVSAMPSPFCGHLGLVWKKNEEYRSIIDLLVKDADRNVYEIGRRANRFAAEIEGARGYFRDNIIGKIVWYSFVSMFFIPKYFFMLLPYLNWGSLWGVFRDFARAGFNVKKFKSSYFGGKRVEVYYLLGSDKYNFLWDKMPYCLTHHYRVQPQTGDVYKLPGCFVFAFREDVEKSESAIHQKQ